MVFLQALDLGTQLGANAGDAALAGGLLAALAAYMMAMSVISIAVYIYVSLAFMSIAKKLKQKTPGLAWIPGIGPIIVAFKASKMPSWPWWLLIGFIIPFVNIVAMIVFTVFSLIWMWKMLEACDWPGAWILVNLIPGIGSIIFLVILGIIAWGKK